MGGVVGVKVVVRCETRGGVGLPTLLTDFLGHLFDSFKLRFFPPGRSRSRWFLLGGELVYARPYALSRVRF